MARARADRDSSPPAIEPAAELDALTLRRAQRGEQAACRALVERYQRPVFALLHRMVGAGRADRVEDLAQETFLHVFRSLAGFAPLGPARLSTWILTIASRRAVDELRRSGRADRASRSAPAAGSASALEMEMEMEMEMDMEMVTAAPSPSLSSSSSWSSSSSSSGSRGRVEAVSPSRADEGARHAALAARVTAAVAALAPEYRAAFLLRVYHGLEYGEIARALECEVGTVKSRINRARAEVRRALEADDEPD
ncbi:MAG TPA: sigma-70 family RNA polymerase sigma factor, partial [Kofleriaceae bacterium]|nr:sigma-70 family RNA polymerase sigma factor [Kofleriaceae bacterium]